MNFRNEAGTVMKTGVIQDLTRINKIEKKLLHLHFVNFLPLAFSIGKNMLWRS